MGKINKKIIEKRFDRGYIIVCLLTEIARDAKAQQKPDKKIPGELVKNKLIVFRRQRKIII